MDSSECTAWSSQNSAVSLFFDRFEQFAHHFNKNCLTISNFSSKSNSDHCSSSVVVFKERSHKWLLFNKFLVDCNALHVILTRIVSQMWTKSKSDYRSMNGHIFRVSHLKCTLIFSVGRGKLLFTMALGLIGSSWRHQNSVCSANVFHSARSNWTNGCRRRWGQESRQGEVKSNLEKNLHLAMPCPGSLLVL